MPPARSHATWIPMFAVGTRLEASVRSREKRLLSLISRLVADRRPSCLFDTHAKLASRTDVDVGVLHER